MLVSEIFKCVSWSLNTIFARCNKSFQKKKFTYMFGVEHMFLVNDVFWD